MPDVSPALPAPRGPICEQLFAALARPPHELELPPVAGADPLAGEDFHLALYCCYELHYRGFAEVDERWEWSPALLAFRQALEAPFEAALESAVPRPAVVAATEMDVALRAIIDADDAPAVSRFVEGRASKEQLHEFLVHRSAYLLKEADPQTFSIPRLTGAPKAAMVEILADEYGGGRPERVHAQLFADELGGVGLDPAYGAYLDHIPAPTLAPVNLMSLLGLHRRHRAELAAAAFDRGLDRQWRRTSYSDLTAGAYEARVASEPEEDGAVVADEPARSAPGGGAGAGGAADGHEAAALRATPSGLAGMGAGTGVGTLVHRVLEAADFAAPDLEAELGAHLAAFTARRPAELGDPGAAAAGLRAALETPLGPLAGDLRLCDVTRADRLDELTFELPLAGGDEPAGRLALGAIAAALREHLPAGDPLAPYAERLGDPVLRQSVRGYLTGSIDLVLRFGDPSEPRFTVVDYKTNWLAPPGEELSAWHHRPAALAAEMRGAHYGLQALLYTVALHRYLRWRLPGYDPDRHLAGVLYLFLRGMTGADTPVVGGQPCGVFAWRPPGALVEALSDVLDAGAP